MTHFKDYLRDIYQADVAVYKCLIVEQEFDDWIEELREETLWIIFNRYLSEIPELRKRGKIAYIVLSNQ